MLKALAHMEMRYRLGLKVAQSNYDYMVYLCCKQKERIIFGLVLLK